MVKDTPMKTDNIISRSKECLYYICPKVPKAPLTPQGIKRGADHPMSEPNDMQDRKRTKHPDKDAAGCLLQMVFHFETSLDEIVQQKSISTRSHRSNVGRGSDRGKPGIDVGVCTKHSKASREHGGAKAR